METAIAPVGLVSADITLNKSILRFPRLKKIPTSPLGFSPKKIKQELCCVHDRNLSKLQVEDVFIKVARMILNKIEDGGVAHSLIRKSLGSSRRRPAIRTTTDQYESQGNHEKTTKKQHKTSIKHCFSSFFVSDSSDFVPSSFHGSTLTVSGLIDPHTMAGEHSGGGDVKPVTGLLSRLNWI